MYLMTQERGQLGTDGRSLGGTIQRAWEASCLWGMQAQNLDREPLGLGREVTHLNETGEGPERAC